MPVSEAAAKTVPGQQENDFANRTGSAKTNAIISTGGDANTEAAVAAALRFLVAAQRPDGAWDPRSSGAGVERSPLGLNRGGAGTRAESAITGLSLLTLLGAGHTHQQGEHADHVYRGLVYLMQHQKPDGSLAGNAAVYASTYSHGMAALAICEAAAITQDPAATQSARRAISHTRRMQHPTTGGWRYLQGDPGDLSQLGWQAMVLDAGYRAKIPIDPRSIDGVNRFLRTVRMGTHGGLASYRPGERASPTMTAEALATRLLMGHDVPAVRNRRSRAVSVAKLARRRKRQLLLLVLRNAGTPPIAGRCLAALEPGPQRTIVGNPTARRQLVFRYAVGWLWWNRLHHFDGSIVSGNLLPSRDSSQSRSIGESTGREAEPALTDPESILATLRNDATELGLQWCGVAPAVEATGYTDLVRWIEAGYAGEMSYIPDRLEAYRHPSAVLDGVRSIIVLSMPYSAAPQLPPARARALGLGSGRERVFDSWVSHRHWPHRPLRAWRHRLPRHHPSQTKTALQAPRRLGARVQITRRGRHSAANGARTRAAGRVWLARKKHPATE